MRIGVMLRHLAQHGGGVLVYTQNVLPELVGVGSAHEFVLFYRDERFLGSHATRANVREIVVRAPSTLLWDQWAVPRAAAREHVDLIFNPKYSVPLATDRRSVFVCHGLDWYVDARWSRWHDRMSHRYLVPRYATKADHVIAVSDTTREGLMSYLGVAEARATTVYYGLEQRFRDVVERAELARVRAQLHLPERFVLYCGQIYPPKNFGRLVRAYARVGPERGIPLVVAGSHTWRSESEVALVDELDLGHWILRLGWVGRSAVPALYALAEALLMPSLYESFGMPILEAMAGGCPVVTSDRYGMREIAGGAARLVNPEDVASIADGMRQVLEDPSLRERLRRLGRERARAFSWRRCAEETLHVLESVGA